jgi:hypothetical protein
MSHHRHLLLSYACLLILSLILAACGSGAQGHTAEKSAVDSSTPASTSMPPAIVTVGTVPITETLYKHWMAIGAATVEMPKPTGPLPTPVAYQPPNFTACVDHLQAERPKATSQADLRATCNSTYTHIQERILNFLITGYWLREEAQRRRASVTAQDVRREFAAQRRARYPTAASFRRLEEASQQTIPDLEFAVETEMLSAKLVERFAAAHGDRKNEGAAVPAFNRNIRATWIPRTSCARGFVVPDCKQYRAASEKTTG